MRRNRRSGGGNGGGRQGYGSPVWLVPIMLIPLALIFWFVYQQAKAREKAENNWQVLAEGRVDHVEYGQHKEAQRRGVGPTRRTETVTIDDTVFFFQDGRSYVARCRCDMPFPSGTYVQIWRNGLGDYRIEKIQ